jgi:hypothetical protein
MKASQRKIFSRVLKDRLLSPPILSYSGQDIFPKFMGWLQEKNPNASDKKGEFEAELKSFEEHIKSKVCSSLRIDLVESVQSFRAVFSLILASSQSCSKSCGSGLPFSRVWLSRHTPLPAYYYYRNVLRLGLAVFGTSWSFSDLLLPNTYSCLCEQGPYIDGEKVTDADLSVAPKLLHARVALKYW